jgi:hypothetical protein
MIYSMKVRYIRPDPADKSLKPDQKSDMSNTSNMFVLGQSGSRTLAPVLGRIYPMKQSLRCKQIPLLSIWLSTDCISIIHNLNYLHRLYTPDWNTKVQDTTLIRRQKSESDKQNFLSHSSITHVTVYSKMNFDYESTDVIVNPFEP